jgi:hypothetical protein
MQQNAAMIISVLGHLPAHPTKEEECLAAPDGSNCCAERCAKTLPLLHSAELVYAAISQGHPMTPLDSACPRVDCKRIQHIVDSREVVAPLNALVNQYQLGHKEYPEDVGSG